MSDLDKIEALDDKRFAVLFNAIVERIKEDPIENFIKAQGFMNFKPSPAQEVVLKVIFGKELDNFTPKNVTVEGVGLNGEFALMASTKTEVQLYEFMTGKDYDPITAKQHITNVDLIMGRRGGKTTVSAMLAVYFAVTENWKPFLSKTPFATILIMSHSREFSDEVLDVIKQLITESPILRRLVNKNRKQTTSTLNLVCPFIVDAKIIRSQVQIKVGAASSKTTRGVAAPVVLADEIAYWNLEEAMKETDAKIMKAVRPATKQFGRNSMIIKLSSPGIKQGVLYHEYDAFQKGTLPKTYVVFKAPSWLMNPILPLEELIEEWVYDQNAFDVEFRANFADSLSNFVNTEYVDLAVQNGVRFLAPSSDREVKYYASIDAAFKKDMFTFSLVGVSDNRVAQYISKGWQGSRSEPVKTHDVASWLRNTLKEYPLDFIAADQYSFNPLKEIFDQYGLTLKEYTFSNTYKKKIYFNLKNLIHRQQIDLLDNEIQTKEIKELVVEQSTTGVVRIGHPVGGTDDFSDSLATSCLLAVEGQGTGKFEFEALSMGDSYGVQVDSQGRTFGAPPVTVLKNSGHITDNVQDNSSLFGVDPADGKLKYLDDFLDDQETEEDEGFSFVI